MMIALFALAVIHPGRTLEGPESEFPRISRKEKKALKKEKKAARMEEKASKREMKKSKRERRRNEKSMSSVETSENDVLDV
jgi:sRNA-binding protein